MLFVLFVFLLVCNLIGMVPYSFTVTSHLIVTLALSLTVYIGVTWILFREHGFHALSLFLPAGAPFALYFLLIGIELISNVCCFHLIVFRNCSGNYSGLCVYNINMYLSE